jgi:hypothetical protein
MATFNDPLVRRIALAIAVLIFIVGIVLAINNFPFNIADLRWQPLLPNLFIGVPVMVPPDTARLHVAGVLHRGSHQLFALREVTLGGSRQYLPLPGGGAVRLAAFKNHGGSCVGQFGCHKHAATRSITRRRVLWCAGSRWPQRS